MDILRKKNASRCVVEDMHKLTAIMKKKYPDVPYFLLGHSMDHFCHEDILRNTDMN